MFAFKQDVLFTQRVFDLIIFNQDIFPDGFNGVLRAITAKFCEEYFSKCASTNHCLNLKVVQCNILELIFSPQ